MDNYTVNNKQGVLCSSLLMKVCTFLILSLFAPKAFAQLDLIHYVPPFYAGTKYDADIGNHWVVLTTPSEEAITVTIKRGDGTLVATVPDVSITTPKRYYFKNEQYGNTYGTIARPNLGIVNYSGLNKVLDNQGLIFTSENSGGKGVAFYVNIRHKSNIHGLSLTAKGQAALGTSFRSGHLHSVRGTTTQNGWSPSSSYIVDHRSHFISVMATEDNTQVTFSDIKVGNLTSDTGTALAVTGDIVRTLNAGESYVLGANHEFLTPTDVNKFNGTKISSDKPIAVNSGSWCGSASTSNKQDIGVDQIVPEKLVGNEYILLQGQGNEGSERPVVVAIKDGTNISVNGIVGFINPTPLNAGESYPIEKAHFTSEGTMLINTSENVYMYQTTAASVAKPYPTIGMNFIPPLSSLGFRQVDIPFINELGTGIVAIYSQNGADVYVNDVKLDQGTAKLVANKEEWVVYIYSTSDENVSVTSNKAIYVAMSVFDNVVGAAGYFSGFTKSISPIDTTIVFNHDLGYICSSQEGNIELEINSTPIPDWYEWYHDIVHLDSIKFKNENLLIPVPTEATKYILKAYFRDPNMDILYNGDFAIGRGSFSSSLDFFNIGQLTDPKKAVLTANPKTINTSFTDFKDLDGVGKMLLAHSSGSGNADTIWQQTINSSTDIPGNLFVIKAYGRLAHEVDADYSEQFLDIYVNDEKVYTNFRLHETSAWNSVKAFWRAGTAETADIRIVDANASGKDAVFALDSITFVPALEATKDFNPDVVPSYSYTPYDKALHLCKGEVKGVADISYGDMGWFNFLWEKKLPDGSFATITDPSITGLDTYELVFNNVVDDHAGIYKCTISFREDYEQCGIDVEPTSVNVEVVVDELARIISLDGASDICGGESVALEVNVEGKYSRVAWSVNGVEKAEGKVFDFNLDKSYGEGVYTIKCDVENACLPLSQEVEVEVFGNPNLTDLQVPTGLCDLSSVNLTAVSTIPVGSTMEYSWYRDDALIETNNLSVFPILPKMTDSYYKVSVAARYNIGGADEHTCIGNELTEILAADAVYPQVVLTPLVDATLCEGESHLYTAKLATAGDYYTYLWETPPAIIGDKTKVDLSVIDITPAMAGTYKITVSNRCGTEISTSDLTVTPKMNVTDITIDKDGPYCDGDLVSFTVDATNANHYMAENITVGKEQTIDPILSPFGLTANAANEGIWNITAIGNCGTIYQEPFTIEILENFSDPAMNNITTCFGEDVRFEVQIETIPSGSELTYAWTVPVGSSAVDSGTAILDVSNVLVGDLGDYTCVVTNKCSISKNVTATLSAESVTTALAGPAVEVCKGAINHSFDIATVGTPEFSWKFDDPNGAEIGTGSSYVIATVDLADDGIYYCDITLECGTVVKYQRKLIVNDDITVTEETPASSDICQGDQAELRISTTGAESTIKWYKPGNIEMTDYAGKTRLLTGALNTPGTFTYRYELTGDCNNPSGDFDVVVHAKPIINPIVVDACEGDVNLNMVVVSADPETSSWWNADESTKLVDGASHTVSGMTYTGNTINYIATTSTAFCTDVVKAMAQVYIYEPISLVSSSNRFPTPCVDESLSLVVNGKGDGLSYQWYKGAALLSGKTNKVLDLDLADLGDEGSYTCKLISTNTCDGVDVDFVVDVREHASITTQPSPVLICEGDGPATFNIVVSSEGTPTYQWYDNDDIMTGETLDNISIADLLGNDGQSYYCKVSDGLCNLIESEKASLTVNKNVIITKDPVSITIAENGVANFTVEAEGTEPFTYKWYDDGALMGGETASTLTIDPAVIGLDGHKYSCRVSNACSTDVASAEATLTVDPAIKITTQPVDQHVCKDDTYNFVVLFKNTATSCTWQYSTNGGGTYNNVTFGTINEVPETLSLDKSTLTVTGATIAMNGWKFRALVTAPDNYSTEVNLKVDIPASFNPIADREICNGSGTGFTVDGLSGSTPFTYVWKRGGTSIGTNSSLNLIAATATDGGYSVEVTSGVCPAETAGFGISHYVDLVINSIIGVDPVCLNVAEDIEVDITLDAAFNASVTYLWTKDDAALTGTTDEVKYNIAGLDVAESGLYKVDVTDGCGTKSATSFVNVLDDIAKTGVWTNQTLCAGDDLSLEASVTGDNPSFDWKVLPAGVADPGNVSTLDINGVAEVNEGTYTCEVTGTCGDPVIYTVDILINHAPNITTDLSPSAVCIGDLLKLGPIAYDATSGENIIWKFNDGLIGLETSPTLNLGTADLVEDGNYRVEVTNACGTDFSIGYQEVYTAPTLAAMVNQTACQGENVIFRAVTTGDNLTYRWLVDDVAIGAFDDKAELVISNIQPTDANTAWNHKVECRVSSCGTNLNQIAHVLVNPNTILNTSIKGEVVYVGSPHVFDLDITGINLNFEWHHKKTDGSDVKLGETTKTLTIASLLPEHAGEYYCIITGDCGVRFTSGYLTVKDPLKIVTGFVSAEVEKCHGDPLNLNISVEGEVFSINWFKGTTDLAHHELNYSIPALDVASDKGVYKCVIVGEGTTITEEVNVIVHKITVLNSGLKDQVLCEHDNLSWIPDVTGSDLKYDWQTDLTTIATTKELTNADVSVDTSGIYKVDITGKCGDVTTQANLTVKELPFFIANSPDLSKCENEPEAVFTVNFGGDDLLYQWQKDGVDIAGANGSELKMINLRVSDAAEYICVVSSPCGITVNSPIMNLNVTPQLKILSESSDLDICDGEQALFNVEVDGTNVIYQWQKNGLDIPGKNSNELIINPARGSDDAFYTCEISDDCTLRRYSDSKELLVNALPSSKIFGRMTLCVFEDRVAYNTVVTPSINYAWLVNGGDFTSLPEGDKTKVTWGSDIEGNKVSLDIVNEATGCSSKLDSLVTLRPLPLVNLTDFRTYGMCEGEDGSSIDLDKGAPAGGIYWVDGIAENEFIPSERGNGEYQVRYSYTDAYGCSNTTGEHVLKVDSLPIVKIIEDVIVGSCETKQLSATTEEGNIRWSPGLYLDDRDSETPIFTAGETTLYVATVVDKHGCVGNDIINVTVAPLPLITTINDTIIGECKEIELTTIISGDTEMITWTNAGDLDEPNDSHPKLIKRRVGVNDYQINVTDKYGCVASGNIQVEVLPNPEIGEDRNLCEGETLLIDTKDLSNPIWSDGYTAWERTIDKPGEYELTVKQNDCELIQKIVMNALPEFKLDNTVQPGIVIFEGQTVTLDSDLDPNTHYFYWSDDSRESTLDVSESGVYKLKVEDLIGCFSTDSVTVDVRPIGIEAPNAFTPLSGNDNDRFYLKDINVIEKFEMFVYNRWGELMYKTDTPGIAGGWDGKYKGTECPVGTYVWVLMLDGKVKEKGTVTLLR